jgi:hypothetical protein
MGLHNRAQARLNGVQSPNEAKWRRDREREEARLLPIEP